MDNNYKDALTALDGIEREAQRHNWDGIGYYFTRLQEIHFDNAPRVGVLAVKMHMVAAKIKSAKTKENAINYVSELTVLVQQARRLLKPVFKGGRPAKANPEEWQAFADKIWTEDRTKSKPYIADLIAKDPKLASGCKAGYIRKFLVKK